MNSKNHIKFSISAAYPLYVLGFDLSVLIAEDKVGVEAQASNFPSTLKAHERARNSQNINFFDIPDCNIRRSISDSAGRHGS
jgi:hypothetical protein